MATQIRSASPVSAKIWTGRVLSTLVVLFLLFDIWGKFTKPQPVVQAFAAQHIPLSDAPIFGTLALLCTVLYLIPRFAPLGVVLLTGYLGGAVAHKPYHGRAAFLDRFSGYFRDARLGGSRVARSSRADAACGGFLITP